MTKKQKKRIEARLRSAQQALMDVWEMTGDFTPEVLNKVKTED